MKPIRVLFVCMGNICRSPAADIVFRKMVADAGLGDRIGVDSAGTIGYHAGNPPDPRMSEVLRRRGYPVDGRARKVTRGDLDAFDLVLAMDEENEADLRRLDRDGSHGDRIRRFTDFCTEHEVDRVPDPYYGGSSGFERVADIIEDGCRGLLERLGGGQPPDRPRPDPTA